MATDRVQFDVVGRDSGASKTFRDVGDAAEKAGDQVEDLGKQSTVAGESVEALGKKTDKAGDQADQAGDEYRGLAREIAEAEAAMRALAQEIDKTGNKDLLKDLRRQQSELRKLTKVKDLLPDFSKAGEDAATGFGASFVARVGPLLAKAPMGSAGAAIGAAIAVPVVITLGAAVAGAVVGGVGIGGIVGGVALAAKDARVRAAGKALSENVMGDLEDSATRFVSPTIRGIQIIQGAWNDVADDVDGIFASTSRYVEPLARGVANAVREITPGLRKAADAAGPIIREIGEGLPRIGRALGDMFSKLSDNAGEGASAVRFLFMVMEEGIGATTTIVTTLADMYGALLDVGEAAYEVADALWGWNPLLSGRIDEGKAKIAELKGALEEGGDVGGTAGEKIEGGLRGTAEAAAIAEGKVRSLNDILNDFANETLDARQANRDFEAAVDAASESVKRNGKAFGDSTPKGRANAEALDAIARTARRQSAAVLASTNSQEQANAVTTKGRAAFLAAAHAMGVEKGEAERLAAKLFAIPNVKRTVSINNAQALAAISRVQQSLGKVKDLHRGIYYTVKGDLKLPGGTQLKGGATGGPVTGPGPKGVDSVPRLLAPGEHIWTAAEVDAVGGQRAMEQLRATVRGDRPTGTATAPGSAGGGRPAAGGGTDAATLATALARALSGMTLVLDDRTGRTAQLMTRGA